MDPSIFLGSVWGIIYYNLEGSVPSQTVFGSIVTIVVRGFHLRVYFHKQRNIVLVRFRLLPGRQQLVSAM